MKASYDERSQALAGGMRAYLKQLGYSKSSQTLLYGCAREFLAYHEAVPLEKLAGEHIQAFYEWLQTRPNRRREGALSEGYVHHHTYALNVFFAWLETSGRLDFNPISAMRFPKPERKSREPLPQEEIRKLFAAASGLRERALLHLFYSCGLRRSEGQALNIRDVHLKGLTVYVRSGKGAKRRAVPMPAKVASELESYLLFERAGADEGEAFLLNKQGKRMKGDMCNDIVKEIAGRAGLEKEISLHYLRHSIATHLLENGLPLEQVRDFLGHADVDTTQIYTKVSQRQLRSL